MSPFDLVRLPQLMKLTAGRPEIMVGLLDGPVAINHSDLAEENTPSTALVAVRNPQIMKKYGFVPDKLVTDDRRSYRAATAFPALSRY